MVKFALASAPVACLRARPAAQPATHWNPPCIFRPGNPRRVAVYATQLLSARLATQPDPRLDCSGHSASLNGGRIGGIVLHGFRV